MYVHDLYAVNKKECGKVHTHLTEKRDTDTNKIIQNGQCISQLRFSFVIDRNDRISVFRTKTSFFRHLYNRIKYNTFEHRTLCIEYARQMLSNELSQRMDWKKVKIGDCVDTAAHTSVLIMIYNNKLHTCLSHSLYIFLFIAFFQWLFSCVC